MEKKFRGYILYEYQSPNNVVIVVEDVQGVNEYFYKNMVIWHQISMMKSYLNDMLVKNETKNLLKFENLANSIIEDMSYEKYHGKILIIIDELEKNSISKKTINKCMVLLNEIRNSIFIEKYSA